MRGINEKNELGVGVALECLGQARDNLLNSTSDMICILTIQGHIVYINESVRQWLGYDPKEIIGKNIFQYVHPDDQDVAKSRIQSRLEKGASYQDDSRFEYRIKKRSDEYRVVQCTVRLLGNHLVTFSRDITTERQLQEQLKVSEAQYRALVEGTREVIAVVDYAGTFLFMNAVAAGQLGGRPHDYIGKMQWDIFPKDIADRQVQSIQQVIDSGIGTSVASLTRVNGEMRWYDTRIEPIEGYTTDGSRCALVVSRDIHDVRVAHEELRQYREKMIRAEHMASMGTLSAMLAHELNQPLTVIRLDVQHALAQCPDQYSDLKESLQDCVKEVETISSIISTFRGFARQTGERPIESVCIQAIVADLLGLFKHATQQSRLKILIESLDELPLVASNSKDLNQMFFALIENTLQATQAQVGCSLTIKGKVIDDFVELSFSDTCGGVPKEYEGRLFEPFFTTKAERMGTGLGLCVVEQIVKRSGGSIRVENCVGKGITFYIRLRMIESIS